jgi:hypothetical protein
VSPACTVCGRLILKCRTGLNTIQYNTIGYNVNLIRDEMIYYSFYSSYNAICGGKIVSIIGPNIIYTPNIRINTYIHEYI